MCLGAALGISRPASLLWFKSDLFTYALGFLMLSMGLTLTFDDFRQVRHSFFKVSWCPCWPENALPPSAEVSEHKHL